VKTGKMSQILCSDWLPERARWSYLSRSGLPAGFPQYLAIFASHLVNNAPIKFVLAGGVLFRPSRRDWETETLVSAGNKVFRFGGKPGGVVNQ